jgi:hypothetical protein
MLKERKSGGNEQPVLKLIEEMMVANRDAIERSESKDKNGRCNSLIFDFSEFN